MVVDRSLFTLSAILTDFSRKIINDSKLKEISTRKENVLRTKPRVQRHSQWEENMVEQNGNNNSMITSSLWTNFDLPKMKLTGHIDRRQPLFRALLHVNYFGRILDFRWKAEHLQLTNTFRMFWYSRQEPICMITFCIKEARSSFRTR